MQQSTAWPSQTAAFVWNRPAVPKQWEDEPFINGQTKGSTEECRLLDAFLDIPEHSSRRNYELPVFERIFPLQTLDDIGNDKYEDPPNHLAAWVHDRNSETRKTRSYNGSMITKKFDKVLKQKVCFPTLAPRLSVYKNQN